MVSVSRGNPEIVQIEDRNHYGGGFWGEKPAAPTLVELTSYITAAVPEKGKLRGWQVAVAVAAAGAVMLGLADDVMAMDNGAHPSVDFDPHFGHPDLDWGHGVNVGDINLTHGLSKAIVDVDGNFPVGRNAFIQSDAPERRAPEFQTNMTGLEPFLGMEEAPNSVGVFGRESVGSTPNLLDNVMGKLMAQGVSVNATELNEVRLEVATDDLTSLRSPRNWNSGVNGTGPDTEVVGGVINSRVIVVGRDPISNKSFAVFAKGTSQELIGIDPVGFESQDLYASELVNSPDGNGVGIVLADGSFLSILSTDINGEMVVSVPGKSGQPLEVKMTSGGAKGATISGAAAERVKAIATPGNDAQAEIDMGVTPISETPLIVETLNGVETKVKVIVDETLDTSTTRKITLNPNFTSVHGLNAEQSMAEFAQKSIYDIWVRNGNKGTYEEYRANWVIAQASGKPEDYEKVAIKVKLNDPTTPNYDASTRTLYPMWVDRDIPLPEGVGVFSELDVVVSKPKSSNTDKTIIVTNRYAVGDLGYGASLSPDGILYANISIPTGGPNAGTIGGLAWGMSLWSEFAATGRGSSSYFNQNILDTIATKVGNNQFKGALVVWGAGDSQVDLEKKNNH